MNLDFVTLDVFTSQRFAGNPLAVVFDPGASLDTARMQAIAREFNLSETTFVRPPRDPSHDAEVRIFTPGRELPWAGHPNVGTAWALALRDDLETDRTYHFEEGAGVVAVAVTTQLGQPIDSRVTAPKPLQVLPLAVPEAMPGALSKCIELIDDDLAGEAQGGRAPCVVSVGNPFPIVELGRRSALERAQGNAAAMRNVLPAMGVFGVLAFTRETVAADHFDGLPTDASARMFAPMAGVPEDPATGSGVAALAAWLVQRDADRGARANGQHRLRIAQGVDMGRPSLMVAEVQLVGGRVTQTSIGGACVVVMRGRLEGSAPD